MFRCVESHYVPLSCVTLPRLEGVPAAAAASSFGPSPPAGYKPPAPGTPKGRRGVCPGTSESYNVISLQRNSAMISSPTESSPARRGTGRPPNLAPIPQGATLGMSL